MNRWLGSVVFLALAFATGIAQTTTSSVPLNPPAAGQAHGVLQVALSKSIDSRKLKVGDPVEAHLLAELRAPDGTVFPRGSRVLGKVTQVTLRSGNAAQSTLAIQFDQLTASGDKNISLQSVLQAVAPNPSSDLNTGGGVGYGDISQTMEHPASPDMRHMPVQLLTEESHGVLGIKNLELSADGVLTSPEKEIKLPQGTRLLLKVTL